MITIIICLFILCGLQPPRVLKHVAKTGIVCNVHAIFATIFEIKSVAGIIPETIKRCRLLKKTDTAPTVDALSAKIFGGLGTREKQGSDKGEVGEV